MKISVVLRSDRSQVHLRLWFVVCWHNKKKVLSKYNENNEVIFLFFFPVQVHELLNSICCASGGSMGPRLRTLAAHDLFSWPPRFPI